MEENNKGNIDRREFLKRIGLGAAVTTAALAGCETKTSGGTVRRAVQEEIPTDKMTYRTNPTSGDSVSLLGYGCMRWPTTAAQGGGDEIDQETVNRLVDFAIADGVNY
ncbi:MAG: aldo/keto reductase, partial [Odoribacter sp.]|nr:aldo/keto reductase [Odoribacter sp.]